MALLHNHPASGIPSAADLISIANKGCEFGIIAAHDGSIYAFRKVSEPGSIYNVTQDDLDEICRLYHSGKRLFRAIRERIGFEIEHFA